MTLINALKDYMQESGASQRAISLRAGLSAKAVSDIMNRPGLNPRHATLVALSQVIGRDLTDLAPAPKRTWAELIAKAIEQGDRGAVSRMRWICRQAGWSPELRTVCKQDVIAFFDANTPASFGIAKASYSTYRSALLRAASKGQSRDRGRRIDDISGIYRDLHEAIQASDLPMSVRFIAGSFLLYLHDMEISPARVSQQTLLGYYQHRLDNSAKSPATCEKHVREIASLLRTLAQRPEFEKFGVAAPEHPFCDKRDRYGVEPQLLAPLLREFDDHVAPWALGMQSRDGLTREELIARLDTEAAPYTKKAKLIAARNRNSGIGNRRQTLESPAFDGFLLGKSRWSDRTLKSRRNCVISLAKAIIATTEVVPETITELTDPAFLETGAEALRDANQGPYPSSYVAHVLKTMRKIAAGYCGRPAEEIAEINSLIDHFDDHARGIAPRNRAKLQKFSEEKVKGTLGLTDLILSDINKAVESRRRGHQQETGALPAKIEMMDADLVRDVMAALAHEIMLARAPRSANLLQIRLDWIAWRGNLARITIPAAEIKLRQSGDADLPIPLPDASSRLLRTYLERLRPMILHADDTANPYLFPGQGSGLQESGRYYQSLLQRVTRLLSRHVGVRIHPHLYRHLIGLIWLRESPDNLPKVQKLLGHKQIQTTLDYYAELDDMRVLEEWQSHLNTQRAKSGPSARARKTS